MKLDIDKHWLLKMVEKEDGHIISVGGLVTRIACAERTAFLYCDGGVVQRNPSPIGGTWAYCWVSADDELLFQASGFVTPAAIGLPAATNNYTELFAAVQGMATLPEGWAGAIFTDSNVTRLRLVCNARVNGIPANLQQRLVEVKKRLGAFTVVLLGGHPTKAQLECGRGKRGAPVSKWNVLCDRLCGEAGVAACASPGTTIGEDGR